MHPAVVIQDERVSGAVNTAPGSTNQKISTSTNWMSVCSRCMQRDRKLVGATSIQV